MVVVVVAVIAAAATVVSGLSAARALLDKTPAAVETDHCVLTDDPQTTLVFYINCLTHLSYGDPSSELLFA